MAEPFNAYHKWLGIASEEFPPSHYRLLGIPQFESDPVVIEHAADQRMAHLRTLQTGQHSAMSQKLLNEIAAARVCLLTPEKKAAYDAKLREQTAAATPREVSPQPMPTATAWGSSTQPIDNAASLTATVEWSALGQLGEYKLLEKLGEGGMGAVFKALHTKLGRVVALKVIRQERKWDQRAIARFEREMQAIGALDHPNIIRAFDARDVGGTRLLAMEFVEGMDLAGIVHHYHELPIADACEIVRQAAVALECAHQHELVHRDIKPSNLMLNRQGCVKLLDLGLARFEMAHTTEEMTASDQAVGTIEYMAPEQFSDSRSVDIRADIYSLGCTFYKLLTGQAPFGGPEYPGTVERLMALASKPIPNIQKLRDDIPKELTRILNRMLAKTPAQRFSTPGEVADALGPFCIGANLPELLAVAEGRSSPDEASQAFQPTPEVISSGLTRFLEQTGIRHFKLPSSARPAAKYSAKRIALHFGLTSLGVALLVCLLLWATRTPATKPVENQPKAATAAVRQSFLILDWPAADRTDCKLYIDASPYERIRATKDAPDQVKVPLPPGEHTVRIIRRDFEPFAQSVSIVAEKDTPLKPEWKPTSAPPSEPPTPAVAPPEAAKHLPLRTLHPLKLPKLTYGNWFPLLTSPNELVGLNRIDPDADYSYSNGLLEVRKDGLWCGAVIKDGGIRAKVNLQGGAGVYLTLRHSEQGCYATYFDGRSFRLSINPIVDQTVGQLIILASVEPPKTYDGWFDYEFSAVGDKLTVCVNGEHILEAHDSTYSQGEVGVVADQYGQFKDIELLIPNKESLVGDASDPSVQNPRTLESISPTETTQSVVKVPPLTFGKWYPLLNSSNVLTGLDTHDPGCEYSYANNILDVRKHSLWCNIVSTDGGIRAKVKNANGGQPYLVIRHSNKGCYLANIMPIESLGIDKIAPDGTLSSTLATAGPQPNCEDWFDAEFSAVGDKLTLSINGNRVIEVRDSTCPQGRSGLGASRHSQYKDIELLIPNKESLIADNRKLREVPPVATAGSTQEPPPTAVAPFDEAQAKEHQKRWAEYLNVPVEQTNSIGMKMVLIPPGEFMMGSPKELIEEELRLNRGSDFYREHLSSEVPQHRIRITKPFRLGATEVTQEAYQRVMGSNPSQLQGDAKRPVEQVTWNNAVEFCRKLSELPEEKTAHRAYRLPTEAEWECACRTGTTTRWHFGDEETPLGGYAWIKSNCDAPHPVGQKQSNAWGLFDMHGSMWEWCADWQSNGYYASSPVDDPSGPDSGSDRVARGGSYLDQPEATRSAIRDWHTSDHIFANLGFRAAQTLVYDTKLKLIPKSSEPPAAKVEQGEKVDEAAEARFAAALASADKLVAAWDFQGAAAELAKVQAEGPDDSAQLAARRAEVDRMAAMKNRIIEAVKTADPPLKKSMLSIRGMNGVITKADDQGLEATLGNGQTENLPWAELGNRGIKKLLQKAVRRTNADDWVATGLLALASRDAPFAEKCFEQAKSLDTKVEPYLGPLAAMALANAQELIAKGQFQEADAVLADIEEQYVATPWFSSNKDSIKAARAKAKASIHEKEAEALYTQAVQQLKDRELFELHATVKKLTANYAETQTVTDTARKPPFEELVKTVEKLGKLISVRKKGKADYSQIQAAIDAAPPNSTIEIQDRGPYNEMIAIPGDKAGLTIKSKRGVWPVITSDGPVKNFRYLVSVNAGAKDVAFDGLILMHMTPAGEDPCCIAGSCSLRRCVVYCNRAPGTWAFDSRWGQSSLETCILLGSLVKGYYVMQDSCIVWGGPTHKAPGKFTNVLFGDWYYDINDRCELKSCTSLRPVIFLQPSSIIDSIVPSIEATVPDTSIKFCCLYGIQPVFIDRAKAGKGCFSADPMFVNPKELDFRLLPKSPCRKKASDGGDLGVRYTPEMIEMIKLAFKLRAEGLIKF